MKLIVRVAFILALVLITYFSLIPAGSGPQLNLWDKAQHFVAYFALGLLCDLSIRTGDRILFKIIAIILYSALIELLQGIVPGRQLSALDLIANTLGVCAAFVFVTTFRRVPLYQQFR